MPKPVMVRFQQTQNICAMSIQHILPNICEMLLKMFINIKTSGLKSIIITFLMIFESLFPQCVILFTL